MALVQEKCDTPLRAALAPVLPAGAVRPVRVHRIPEGIIAAYDPTQEDRASVWQMLVDVFGPLFDVTPAEVAL